MTKDFDPLETDIAELPLSDSPLVKVLTQVRFPIKISVEKPDFIATFQEAIQSKYPFLELGEVKNLNLGKNGDFSLQSQKVWTFTDNKKDPKKKVVLTSSFLTFEDSAYSGRKNFIEGHLQYLIKALNEHIKPSAYERLGIRYINQIRQKNLDNLCELVEKPFWGFEGSRIFGDMNHSMSQALFLAKDKGKILIKWGHLGPGQTSDSSLLKAINEKSWILDLDASTESELDHKLLANKALELAKRTYAFFRWAVTNKFIKEFGGEIND